MDSFLNGKVKKMKFNNSHCVNNYIQSRITLNINVNDNGYYSNDYIHCKNPKSKFIEEIQCELDGTETTRSLSSCSILSQSESFCLIRTSSYKPRAMIEPVELFHGAILGRTVVSRISGNKRKARHLKDLKRIDLGIGYKNNGSKHDDGISQDHIKIMCFNEEGIVMKVCDKVRNPIAVKTGTCERQYRAGQIISLKENDVLIFDKYMKRPRHSFMLKRFI